MGAMAAAEEEICREKIASRADAVLVEAAEARVRFAKASIRCCEVRLYARMGAIDDDGSGGGVDVLYYWDLSFASGIARVAS